MKEIKIYPLDCGRSVTDQSIVTYRKGMGKTTTTSFACFYVEADGKKIMVDTGPASGEHAVKWHKEVGPNIGPDQVSYIQLEKRVGVKPKEIDMILLTHLHWDHGYYMEKYPNAKIYVSKKELDFALNPLPPFFFSYENWQLGLTPFFIPSIPRMVQIDMVPQKITEHISMVPTPGHAPGHMAVVVETGKGRYVLPGDAVIRRENLEVVPERHIQFQMVGLFMDLVAQWKSMETIMKIVEGDKSRILCNHDPEVIAKDVYP